MNAIAPGFPVEFRQQDQSDPFFDKTQISALFSPPTVGSMILGLSAVTAGFYGLLLKTMREQYPACDIDRISKSCFEQIGCLKAGEYLATDRATAPIFRDTRGVVMTLILAIHNASPEYIYEVRLLAPRLSRIRLTGKDRYLRIARRLGISDHLEWPTLTPFLQGAARTLDVPCAVSAEATYTNGIDELDVTYTISHS